MQQGLNANDSPSTQRRRGWTSPVRSPQRKRILIKVQPHGAARAGTALLLFSLGCLIAGCGFTLDPEAERDAAHGSVLSVRYVERAIAHYDDHGLQSAVNRYTELWQEGNFRYLMIYDVDGTRVFDPYVPADGLAATSRGLPLAETLVEVATDGGGWFSLWFPNPMNGAVERKHIYAVEHDGLVFASGYYPRRV